MNMLKVSVLWLLLSAVALGAVEAKKTSIMEGLSTDEKVVMLTILAEARGEKRLGMFAVACVIKQRAIERRLTPAKVCLQKMQFSCWNGLSMGDLEKKMRGTDAKVMECAKVLAKRVTSGEKIDRSLISFSNHYCVTKLNPKWSRAVKPVAVISHHKFFRL